MLDSDSAFFAEWGGNDLKKLKLILTGAAAGFLNGLFGAGGGMIVVPMLQQDGLAAKQAHATSIAIILPLSIASGILYITGGKLEFMDAIKYIPFGLVGAWLGGRLLPRIKTVWLHRIFGIIVLYAAVRLGLQ